MYEKPQYLTSKGLRRTRRNPLKDRSTDVLKTPGEVRMTPVKRPDQIRSLSPEAAKAIAAAIKGLLHSK